MKLYISKISQQESEAVNVNESNATMLFSDILHCIIRVLYLNWFLSEKYQSP